MSTIGTPSDMVACNRDPLGDRAVRRLREKRAHMAHALAYITVNLLLIAIWLPTGASSLLAGPRHVGVGYRPRLQHLERLLARAG
jgi:hypothetical protein